MDPRLLLSFQSDSFTPYSDLNGSQHHLPSLSSLQPVSTSFYNLDSYEHPPPGVPSSSLSTNPLPPQPERLSHPLPPLFDNLQPAPLNPPFAPQDPAQWARDSGLDGGYASSQVFRPGYDDMLQLRSGSMQLAPTKVWSTEPHKQQLFHAWNCDRPRPGGLGEARAFMRAPKVWPKKRHGKLSNSMQIGLAKPKGSELAKLVNVVSTAGKPKSQEGGPGWCSLCRINCNTDAMLKQHCSGKKHRKHLQQQDSAVIVKPADIDKSIDGSTVADVIEQMWLTVSAMGRASKSTISEADTKIVAAGNENSATATDSLIGNGKKRLRTENKTTEIDPCNSAGPNGLDAADSSANMGIKKQEQIRCELCNVECNSRIVLESHFNGKKHQSVVLKSKSQT